MSADRFYNAIPEEERNTDRMVTSFFVYFLNVERGNDKVTAGAVGQCFIECDLTPPGRLAQYLTEGLTSSPPRYVKAPGGYRLHRAYKDHLSSLLGTQRVVQQTSAELRALEGLFTDGDTKAFLQEAINCFEAGANRAAVIMTWVLTFDHFLNYVFANKLTEFNRTFAASNPQGRVRIIAKVEDFEEINEDRIITTCRTAGIITSGVQKTLKEGLDTRNTAAHPSNVTIARSKAISVIEDLVTNVIKKF